MAKPKKELIHRVLLLTSQAVFLVIAVSGLTAKSSDQAGWLGLAGFALTFIPDILRRLDKLVLPISYEVVVVGYIFLSFIAGENFNLYGRFWWWDHMLHLASGFIVGYVAMLLVYIQDRKTHRHTGAAFAATFTIGLVLTSAVLWEIFEFSVDQYAHGHMQYGLIDTMNDIILGAWGGVVMMLLAFWYFKKHSRHGWLTKQFDAFVDRNPGTVKGA